MAKKATTKKATTVKPVATAAVTAKQTRLQLEKIGKLVQEASKLAKEYGCEMEHEYLEPIAERILNKAERLERQTKQAAERIKRDQERATKLLERIEADKAKLATMNVENPF